MIIFEDKRRLLGLEISLEVLLTLEIIPFFEDEELLPSASGFCKLPELLALGSLLSRSDFSGSIDSSDESIRSLLLLQLTGA